MLMIAQAPGELQVKRLYGVSTTVAALGVALYVLGFGIGPLFCMSYLYLFLMTSLT